MSFHSYRKNALIPCIIIFVNLIGLIVILVYDNLRQSNTFITNGDSFSEDVLDKDDTRLMMTVEDTEKYGMYGSRANSEWLATTPANNGFVRIGEEHRYMLTAFGHQIHCVRVLRMAIVNPTHPEATPFHLSHCLSYLRAYALCNADLTLEKHDPLRRNFTSEEHGAVHVCHDSRRVYDELRRNNDTWIMGMKSGRYPMPNVFGSG